MGLSNFPIPQEIYVNRIKGKMDGWWWTIRDPEPSGVFKFVFWFLFSFSCIPVLPSLASMPLAFWSHKAAWHYEDPEFRTSAAALLKKSFIKLRQLVVMEMILVSKWKDYSVFPMIRDEWGSFGLEHWTPRKCTGSMQMLSIPPRRGLVILSAISDQS